jgi:hypothetical protein
LFSFFQHFEDYESIDGLNLSGWFLPGSALLTDKLTYPEYPQPDPTSEPYGFCNFQMNYFRIEVNLRCV